MDRLGTGELGQLTGILAVDVCRFSKHNDIQQEQIATQLPSILHDAAKRAGLSDIMRNTAFDAFRGDGYLIGFDPDRVADVVDRYFDSLQAELRRRSSELRAVGIALRLRASLHLAPLRSFDKLVADSPSARPMVESARMVDAKPVRALLDHSDPGVTLVATVVSEDVMRNVIEAGRTARQPSEFVAAPLRIEAKDYSGTGYLRVPVPSGELLRHGLLRGQPEHGTDDGAADSEEQPIRRDGAWGNSFSGHAEKVNQARDVSGGINDSSVNAGAGGIAVRGNNNMTAGGNVRTGGQQVAEQVFSGEFKNLGDANFGPSSGRRINEHTAAEDV
ncbi:hypothetical protein SZMC14600_16796 [Saccharomonospora azurea SZMC 14600]|nr:hypothetical protein [Saccharomonospora azurea]EHK85310.1 hypothetical protein SZMC14600_16796 [Saccharomonospora azurea SZMC 14600]